jgi:hypothetical protein
MPPDLSALPPGCSFAARCRFAEARCSEAPTSEFASSSRHTVRCRRVAAGEIGRVFGIVTVPGQFLAQVSQHLHYNRIDPAEEMARRNAPFEVE